MQFLTLEVVVKWSTDVIFLVYFYFYCHNYYRHSETSSLSSLANLDSSQLLKLKIAIISVLNYAAAVNVNLAVVNMLPLPGLGKQIRFYSCEMYSNIVQRWVKELIFQ